MESALVWADTLWWMPPNDFPPRQAGHATLVEGGMFGSHRPWSTLDSSGRTRLRRPTQCGGIEWTKTAIDLPERVSY